MTATTTPPSSYSTAEVARLLGVSVPTVQRWVDTGYLNAWKTAGGHRRIEARSVERVLQAQADGGLSEDSSARSEAQLVVMIVEDNPDDRDILSVMVEGALPQAKVVMAHSGFEALLAMGRNRPDVLITDIVMPHMNGIEMLKHLLKDQANAPPVLLAVSSRTRPQLARLGELPESVPLIVKPIQPKPFIDTLRMLVEGIRVKAS